MILDGLRILYLLVMRMKVILDRLDGSEEIRVEGCIYNRASQRGKDSQNQKTILSCSWTNEQRCFLSGILTYEQRSFGQMLDDYIKKCQNDSVFVS